MCRVYYSNQYSGIPKFLGPWLLSAHTEMAHPKSHNFTGTGISHNRPFEQLVTHSTVNNHLWNMAKEQPGGIGVRPLHSHVLTEMAAVMCQLDWATGGPDICICP